MVHAVPGDLPAIAVCAGIAVVRRPWRWQAGGRRGGMKTIEKMIFPLLSPTFHYSILTA